MTTVAGSARTVHVTETGLFLDGAGDLQPISGSIHSWRHDVADWDRILDSFSSLGLRVVDLYIPWTVHHPADGETDWTGSKDVVSFLRSVHERGLRAIIRIGPHCGAELADSGIPAHVHRDPRVQALRCSGVPYVLPTATHHIAVPSYFSTVFRQRVDEWYADVVSRVAPLQWPDGPIVACQVDNEHGYFFQAHAYALDYHPETLAAYRAWLGRRYGSVGALNDAYGTELRTFADVEPPRDAADHPEHRRLDWVEWREVALRDALLWLRRRLEHHGMMRVPFFHNDFPRTDTPLDQGALERSGAVDVAAVDIYATRRGAWYVADLVRHVAGSSRLAWLAECGVGWITLPWLLPMGGVDPADTEFVVLAALLSGARATNFYMTVERERWYGSPIDRRGGIREDRADVMRRITSVVDTLRLHELRRDAPVLLLGNRAQDRRRAGRATLGGLVPAYAGQLPFDFALTQVPDDEDVVTDAWHRDVSTLLREVGLDHNRAVTSSLPSLEAYDCVLVPSADVLDREAWSALRMAARAGVTVAVGPRMPSRDEDLMPLDGDAGGLRLVAATGDVRALLPAPHFTCGSSAVAIHRWTGAGRELLAVMNHSDAEAKTTLTARDDADLTPMLGGTPMTMAVERAEALELAPWETRVWEVAR